MKDVLPAQLDEQLTRQLAKLGGQIAESRLKTVVSATSLLAIALYAIMMYITGKPTASITIILLLAVIIVASAGILVASVMARKKSITALFVSLARSQLDNPWCQTFMINTSVIKGQRLVLIPREYKGENKQPLQIACPSKDADRIRIALLAYGLRQE